MKKFFVLLSFLIFAVTIQAQSVLGKWKTIDDETGKAKSIVELYMKDGKIHGRILEVFKQEGEPLKTVCTECKDYRKDQKLVGMEIITALEQDGDEWQADKAILDPANGKIYDCKIWLEDDNKLAVRGYIAFFFRTQYWIRVE